MSGWLSQADRGNLLGLRLMLKLIRRPGGRAAAKLVIWFISSYFFCFSINSRRASKQFLQKARPATKHHFYHTLKHYHHYGMTIIDRAFMLTAPEQHLTFCIHGLEHLKQQQGYILLGSHLGSFEAMRSLAIYQAQVTEIKALMNTAFSSHFNRLAEELNPHLKDLIIPSNGFHGLLQAQASLNKGGCVGILGDRSYPKERIYSCPFLGDRINLPLTPYYLASLTQVPIVTFFALYQGKSHYDIYIEPLISGIPNDRKTRLAIMQQTAMQFAQRLEHYARLSPYNWFNFYNIWQREESTHG